MKRNTVILYHPKVDFEPYYPCYWAPLSILSVASPLVAQNKNVILLDGNLGDDEKDKSIIRENLDNCICIGVSTMIGGRQLERALNFAAFVKKLSPRMPIVFGGPLPTIIPETLLLSPLVDFVVRGQGEKPFSDLVNAIKNGCEDQNIPGVTTSRGEINGSPIFLDKNQFPPYPWELLEIERYIRQDKYLGKRVMNYVSSQGCPYKCGYCNEVASFNCRWKSFSAHRMLNEIQELKKGYGLDGVKFYDSNFFVNPRRVLEFSEGLLRGDFRLSWGASSHPKGIIKLADNLGLIRSSGLNRLLIGMESGSQASLDYISKGCTVEDNVITAEICARHKIPATFTFIVGIPGVEDDIVPTLEFILKIKRIWNEFDVKIHFYAPMPGTPLFGKAIELGYKPPGTPEEWSRYDYYIAQTPWLNKGQEKKVRMFDDFYCNFLFPPQWFIDLISRNIFSRTTYSLLRKLVGLRCKFHFYCFPYEMNWFRKITGKKVFD